MKKTIVAVLILIILVLLGNWWAGRIISSGINERLLEITADDQLAHMEYDDISVSPLLSQITFSNFSYRNADNAEFRAETIRTSFTYLDFINQLTGKPGAFNEISFLSMYFHNSSWIDYSNSNEITLVDGFITLRGSFAETLRAAVQKRLPDAMLSLDLDLYELHSQDLSASQGFLPGFQQYNGYDYINTFHGSFDYDPVLEEIQIRNGLLHAPLIQLEFDGTAKYDNIEHGFLPGVLKINYALNTQPGNTRFTITPGIGQIMAENIKIQSTAAIEIDDPTVTPALDFFFTEGETIFNLNRIRLHPSDRILQQYGMISQAFGLDLQTLYLNSVSGRYTLENDRLLVYNTVMETGFFTATLDADVTMNENDIQNSVINEGSLRISDMTQSIEKFFRDAAVLLDTEWQRDNDDILILFRGRLASPELIE